MNRRTFLAAGAASVAAPALAIAQAGDTDVVVVGAGAAGIAAARRIVAAGRRCVMVEATDRVGGRCVTDTGIFGVPYDQGAHAIHRSDINPLAKLARGAGLDVYTMPPGQRLRVGRRFAREGELEDFLAALVRATRAIGEAARAPRDVAAVQALPKDLGEWRPTVEFILGPSYCGRILDELSAQDLSRSTERDSQAYCRQGYGALLAKLADGLPVRLETPVRRIATWGGTAYVETSKGALQPRAVIVTASTAVIGKIKFEPDLPKRHVDVAAKLPLGNYERIALELAGNPLGLEKDDLVFEKAGDARTAALLANVSGTSLCFVDVAGKFGRGLPAQGEGAMQAFALDWLAGLFGNDVKKAVKRTHVTQWAKEPWALGSFSSAAPGGQPGRRILAEPVRDRIWFAGEATHETQWGTVGGAWESGEQAADAVIRRLGGAVAARPQREPGEPKAAGQRAKPKPAAKPAEGPRPPKPVGPSRPFG